MKINLIKKVPLYQQKIQEKGINSNDNKLNPEQNSIKDLNNQKKSQNINMK